MTHHDRQALAALTTLILLQSIMLSALYAGIRPHPPVATPLFGIAPFLGASVSAFASCSSTPVQRTKLSRHSFSSSETFGVEENQPIARANGKRVWSGEEFAT